MKQISTAVAAIAALVLLAQPVQAGNSVYGYNPAQPVQRNTAPNYTRKKAKQPDPYNALRAQQIRNECRTYAFRYWRYHPDYKHCRYQ